MITRTAVKRNMHDLLLKFLEMIFICIGLDPILLLTKDFCFGSPSVIIIIFE